MVRGKEAKSAGVLAAAVMYALWLLPITAEETGIYSGAEWWHSLTWQWFHGSIWHLSVNAWALLTIVFMWNAGIGKLLTAYATSVVYGLACATDTPIVGMSGVIYALLGLYALSPRGWQKRLRYQLYVAAWIVVPWAVGMVIPKDESCGTAAFGAVAVEAHVACYVMGIFVAIINYPWFKVKKD